MQKLLTSTSNGTKCYIAVTKKHNALQQTSNIKTWKKGKKRKKEKKKRDVESNQ